ncbi:MAG: pyridoxamine 5'-phosphate oxidase family protein [Pseudomonadales bacterium]|nr:pyridoxamine 5'-phosphate oxidase family protein [Pseudomonadales bacterium]
MSRRDKIRMTEEEIREFIADARTMILVSNGNYGYPHPMPMWYAVDADNTVYMTTFRKSQKVNNIRRDPKVTLLVESGDQYQELKSVLIYATAEIIDDLDTTIETLGRVSVTRGDLKAEQLEAARDALAKNASKRVTLKFTPEKVVSWDHSKLAGAY